MKKSLIFGIVGWNIAETTRMIEIAKCAAKDFNVYFASYGGQFNNLVHEAGFPLYDLEPQETPEKIERLWKIDRGEKFAHPYSQQDLHQRVEAELNLYRQIGPSALVMGSVLSFPISARVAKIPLVNVIPFALSRCYLNNKLPIVPDAPPLLNSLFNLMALKLPILTQHFNQVAKAYQLPKFKNLPSIWEGDYNLLTEIPTLYNNLKLDRNWSFVGPIYAKLDGQIPPKVLQFIQESKVPTVYFAMGSSANRDFLKIVVEAFSHMPLRIIAPIKSHTDQLNIAIPENMLVTDWLPAHKVNPLCHIAVIHGGQGTVQTACESGTPFIGIGMQPEQVLNIACIVTYGAALRLTRRNFNKEVLQEAINTLLNNPTFKTKALELQAESQQINGAENVAIFLKKHF